MVEQDEQLSQKLKHTGIFDYKELYNFCYGWFSNEDYNLAEELYTEKISAIGKEVIIKWKAWKKVTDYFKYVIKVSWHIIGMNDVEVEINGKKMKMQKGDLELSFKAILEKDYESRWKDSPTHKFMRGIYDKYITKTTCEKHETHLINKATDLIENVKVFLNLDVKK